MWSTLLHILFSRDRQVALWMSLCWYHVPVTAKSLPSAKFTIRSPLSYVSLWRLGPSHAGYKQDSFSSFLFEVPYCCFQVIIGNCITYLIHRNKKFFFGFHFFSWDVRWWCQCQIVIFKFNPNFTNPFVLRFKI